MSPAYALHRLDEWSTPNIVDHSRSFSSNVVAGAPVPGCPMLHRVPGWPLPSETSVIPRFDRTPGARWDAFAFAAPDF